MSDFFKPKKVSISTKKVKQKNIVENPILFSNSDNPEITFVVDQILGKELLLKFHKYIIQRTEATLKNQILYCFKYKPDSTAAYPMIVAIERIP